MGNGGNDKTYNLHLHLYCLGPSGADGSSSCQCVNHGEGVDFLVVGLCSIVVDVEWLKFLCEGCTIDVEASDGELWCWQVGCNISWFFVIVVGLLAAEKLRFLSM
jgi:hypothetical protein